MDDINKRIETEICQDTINKMSDEKLLSEYIRCKSVKTAIKKLEDKNGFKYIENTSYNNKTKLLCVVCNKIIFTSDKNKAYKLFKIGFENNTLCYLNNLENIIKSYFLL